uniref:Tudor domain-containing protein n=1 Tax=Wuchereria bancrofti TaxID=6293 RepID=A0A1I8EL83_WUCBA
MLLINETNCQVLGGNVEKMIEKWNMEKNWLQKPVRNIESNAPKWTQFSKQRLPQSSLPVNATNEMFRANDIISGLNKRIIDERGDDFSAARKAQIDHVIENNTIKKFARSQLKPKPIENCASTSCNNNSKKDPVIKGKLDAENMDRRLVRDDKKNLPVHRPSNPPTLYDFMQSKVPMPDGISTEYENFGNLQFPMEKIETNQQNVEIQGMDRPRKGRFNERGFRYQQTPDNTDGSHVIEISNSNRYRKQCNWRLGREQNYATNMVNDRFRVNHADDQLVSTANKELSALHLSSIDNGPLSFYPSTLVSMGPADMCTIEYDEYGNRSSVPVGVLLPFQTF